MLGCPLNLGIFHWILGSKSILDAKKIDKWEQLLFEIGINESKISKINLSE